MKRSLYQGLAALLVLLLALPIPGRAASATGTIANVKISPAGVITWDAYPDAEDDYLLDIDGAGIYAASGANLKSLIEEHLSANVIRNTRTHVVGLTALRKTVMDIVATWSGTYDYLSPNYPEYTVPTQPLKDTAKLSGGVLSWQARSSDTARYAYGVAAGGRSVSNLTTELSVDLHAYINEAVTNGDLPYAESFRITLEALDGASQTLETFAIEKYGYVPTIQKINVDDGTAMVYGIQDSYPFAGAPVEPAVGEVYVRGKLLQRDVDYTLSYEDNAQPGVGYVVITGKGRYTGVTRAPYNIAQLPPTSEPETPEPTPSEPEAPAPIAPAPSGPADLSLCAVTLADQTYTGKALKPAPTVIWGDRQLVAGTDYAVSYKGNKNVGEATVTLTGRGEFVGTVKAAFRINPKGTSLSKLTPGKKKLTVAWKKQSAQVTGYQLEYATKKSFKNAKRLTVKGAKTTKKVLTKLKAGTKYYVRVRTYRKAKGKTYYSAWSKAKSAKVK